MSERSLPKLKTKKKPVKKLPPNFTDLRQGARPKKSKSQVIQDIVPPSVKRRFKLWWRPELRSRLFFIVSLILVTVIAVLFGVFHHSSLVPAAIKKEVSFTIYYPDQNKLPVGYTLDTHSFTASSQTVLYKVSGPNDTVLNFSVQKNPGTQQINQFYTNNLTLHTDVTTSIGTARVGAVGEQSVTSLPTNGNAWILITAPGTINQNQLGQILKALRD